jgi:hypothetical protein
MSAPLKIIGSIVGIVLIFAGGVDFGLTTLPGLAILAVVWGYKKS